MNGVRFCRTVNAVEVTLQRTESAVMKRILRCALAIIVLGISGCADGKYPISGEACGPDDPVHKLDSHDCLVVPVP
jgi:hypothetical protein